MQVATTFSRYCFWPLMPSSRHAAMRFILVFANARGIEDCHVWLLLTRGLCRLSHLVRVKRCLAMAMLQPGRSSSCCSSMLEARGGSSLAGRPLGMAGARRRGAERRNLSPTDAASAHESKERSVKEHALAMEGRSAGVVRRPFPITQTRVWLALILPRNLTMSAQDFRE